MEGSSIDDSTTSDSISLTPVSASTLPVLRKSPVSLCRVGSGSSVILDCEGGIEAESRKLPSSRFKGVVPQPNGRWGAQIYEKHQRVWLGTFNEEEEAAKAYDIAAQRFRGRGAVTNFKPLLEYSKEEEEEDDDIETSFLNSRSKAEIVDMLRKHTYNDELEQSKRHHGMFHGNDHKRIKDGFISSNQSYNAREQLFEKAVTPSDVGKLNRLVIPKQHAEKHFPMQGGNNSNCTTKGFLLNFEDVGGKVWRFRYSYWNSSQSYVLTKGWSRFVKEKQLKAGDVVSFQRSTGPEKQLYIDWKGMNGSGSVGLVSSPVQVVRLFGVNIFKVPISGGVEGNGCSGGKRMRGKELLGFECSKKQRVIIDAL